MKSGLHAASAVAALVLTSTLLSAADKIPIYLAAQSSKATKEMTVDPAARTALEAALRSSTVVSLATWEKDAEFTVYLDEARTRDKWLNPMRQNKTGMPKDVDFLHPEKGQAYYVINAPMKRSSDDKWQPSLTYMVMPPEGPKSDPTAGWQIAATKTLSTIEGFAKAQTERAAEACHKCGAVVPKDAKFCPKCGAAQEQKGFCPKCGKAIHSGDTYCGSCGAKITKSE